MDENESLNRRIIAIDGPAGSGKTTLGRSLARKLKMQSLDTGAMYRAVAYGVIKSGLDKNDPEVQLQIAREGKIESRDPQIFLNGEDITEEIRSSEVSAFVSQVASSPKVREVLCQLQRNWVKENGGGILEGRDIGTVVFPDAAIKIYLTADDSIRAKRRAEESGQDAGEVETAIKARDDADSSREHSPLTKAEDAVEIDTSSISPENMVKMILNLPKLKKMKKRLEKIPEGPFVYEPIRIFGTKPKNVFHKLFFHFIRLGCYLGFRIYLRGRILNKKNLPKSGTYIITPGGHRSNLDTPVVSSITSRYMHYMANSGLFKTPFWRKFISHLGGFPVNREKADLPALRMALRVLEKGSPLVLFPEGERKTGPDIWPLLEGVAWIASRSQASIVPVGLGGTEKVMPKGVIFIRPRKVRIIIGEPIKPPSEKSSRQELNDFTEKIRKELQVLFTKAENLVK